MSTEPSPAIQRVFEIRDSEGHPRDYCFNQEVAERARPEYSDFHGHGSATVVVHNMVQIDGQFYLLGPRISLETTKAVQEAKIAIGALSKLTEPEIAALLKDKR